MAVEPLRGLHLQGHKHLFIDFQPSWPKKNIDIDTKITFLLSSMFLAKDTKNTKNSALYIGPFHFCTARGRAAWEIKWHVC